MRAPETHQGVVASTPRNELDRGVPSPHMTDSSSPVEFVGREPDERLLSSRSREAARGRRPARDVRPEPGARPDRGNRSGAHGGFARARFAACAARIGRRDLERLRRAQHRDHRGRGDPRHHPLGVGPRRRAHGQLDRGPRQRRGRRSGAGNGSRRSSRTRTTRSTPASRTTARSRSTARHTGRPPPASAGSRSRAASTSRRSTPGTSPPRRSPNGPSCSAGRLLRTPSASASATRSPPTPTSPRCSTTPTNSSVSWPSAPRPRPCQNRSTRTCATRRSSSNARR